MKLESSLLFSQQPTTGPIPSQMNPVHTFPFYILKFHLNSILQTHIHIYFVCGLGKGDPICEIPYYMFNINNKFGWQFHSMFNSTSFICVSTITQIRHQFDDWI
jgi:hypothetical protein